MKTDFSGGWGDVQLTLSFNVCVGANVGPVLRQGADKVQTRCRQEP